MSGRPLCGAGNVSRAAPRYSARAEDSAIFHGFRAGDVTGIVEASPHAPIDVSSKIEWPLAVSAAKEVLRLAGVNGPYALALGPRAYAELTAESEDGYPLRKRIEQGMVGAIVWAPVVEEGAVLMGKVDTGERK